MENEKLWGKTWFVILMIIIFFPVGLFLMWRYRKFNQGIRILISILFCFWLIGNFSGDEKAEQISNKEDIQDSYEKEEKIVSEVKQNKTNDNTESKEAYAEDKDWLKAVKDIATSNKTKTEKQDAVVLLEDSFSLDTSEIRQFEVDIIEDYQKGTYLNQIENEEYMLINIFKSYYIEQHYEDSQMLPIDSFAFDFFQNTKYTYRGVDAVDSEAVKANESQMDRALASM